MRLAGALAVLLAGGAAAAHPIDLAGLDLRVEGATVRAALDFNVEIGEQLTGRAPDTLRTDQAVKEAAAALYRATLGSGALEASGQPCRAGEARARLDGQRIRVGAEHACPAAVTDLRWTFPFVDQTSLDYRVVAKVAIGGEERTFLLEPGATTLRVSAGTDRSFGSFVMLGVRHIGAHPGEWRDDKGPRLAPGIDHILFLLALILAGGGLWRTLATVTGFTVGHSITLALASLKIVTLPSRPVEIAIAASIVYVALRDVFAREPSKHGFAIAAAFGLVHGFGFAAALDELDLSRADLIAALFGFNLGVELGQAVIVALLAPAVMLLRRRPWFQRIGMKIIACAIAAAGLFWLLQRALGKQ